MMNNTFWNVTVSNYTDNTRLTIFWGDGWANILLIYHMAGDEEEYSNHNPEDNYTYFNEEYMGMGDAPIAFDDGQSIVQKEICCNDFTLVANIFAEWALRGEQYPTTWITLTMLNQKEKAYAEKNPPPAIRYFRLALTHIEEHLGLRCPINNQSMRPQCRSLGA